MWEAVGIPSPNFLRYGGKNMYVDDTNILDKAIDDADLAQHITELVKNDTELQNNLVKLRRVYEAVQRENTIQKTKLTRASKLSDILNGQGNKIIINEEANRDRIVQQILEGYHLTSIILQQLGFIRKVNYTITYVNSKGEFVRAGNLEITPDMMKLEAASRGRGYSLRLREGVVKAKIEGAKTNSSALIFSLR